MERVNFQVIEKKWQAKFASTKLQNKKGEKYYCLEMFLIHLEIFIWDTLEIIQLEMLLLDINF